jgi:hypothetical protein
MPVKGSSKIGDLRTTSGARALTSASWSRDSKAARSGVGVTGSAIG